MKSRLTMLLGYGSVLLSTTAWGGDAYNIYVAPKGTPAEAAAQALVKGTKNASYQPELWNALAQVKALLQNKETQVFVRLARADYFGQGKSGKWEIPQIQSPKGEFFILGGYAPDFKSRDPFKFRTNLVTAKGQSAYIIKFLDRDHAYKKLVISGLTIDSGPRQTYDGKTKGLRTDMSPTKEFISHSFLTTDDYQITDNIFVNAAYTSIRPNINPVTDKARALVRNNFFINNVHNVVVEPDFKRTMVDRVVFEGNTVIGSWPIKMDPKGANPGSIRVGEKRTANTVEFARNLFFDNVTGAIFEAWDTKDAPKLILRDNLHYRTGNLFKPEAADTGLVVGRFFGQQGHSLYAQGGLENDFPWEVSGNVSFDPEVEFGTPKLPDAKLTVQTWSSLDNYAPIFDLAACGLPLTKNPKATAFGASAARISQYP